MVFLANRFHRQHLQEEPQGIQRSSPGLVFVACNSVSWEFFVLLGFVLCELGNFLSLLIRGISKGFYNNFLCCFPLELTIFGSVFFS